MFICQPNPALNVCAPCDLGEIVAEARDLLAKPVARRRGAAEVRDPGDGDLRTRTRDRVGHVVLVAIRLGSAQFVQHGGRKRGKQLEAADVRAIVEVHADAQRVQSAVGGIERILVAEIIVAEEDLSAWS